MSDDTAAAGVTLAELSLQVGTATHTGLRRRANEDAFLAAQPLFLVADGMGGHEAGEVASALAVDAFAALTGTPSVDAADLRDAFGRAHESIAAIVSTGLRRAGTTVSGVAIAESDGRAHWLVFNLGDSRTYRLADGELEQISVDHSVVQEMLDGGTLSRAAAATHPERNVITRALGAGGPYQADYWLVPVESGDRILICSDGVSGELDDELIERILLEEHESQEAASRLVHEGLLHGGRDNLTAVVVDAYDRAGAEAHAAGSPDGPGGRRRDPHGEDTIPRPPVDVGGRN
ncbi:serine/threonine-protein phosphatase [Herbiconiux sp. VKM Ac-1786]|uniref:PP2C family protein-serine/threonine phosphatase n=1 Tax=Herbiconiux sp. VKM Ac-1786 TaxID=2783824 RepID=UPI00188DAB2E|nr:protein phosphatase 2C domain-containing protein [Herbiconiux sp. VKM Ac-1786]MBF4572078.1 serine/threonine-protein phosphatase [Herbiconiux sp. VKM Ac-1786]